MEFKSLFLSLTGIFLLILVLMTASFSQAQDKPLIKIEKTPQFALPIECSIGKDCWVMNYVDIGPNDGKKTDIACQSRTYNGHKGTDIALADEITMKNGVNVLAAIDGTIKKIRDGEPDRWATSIELSQTKEDRKECGNAILIDHGNGLQSLYCHLKKNSIRVKTDQKIKKGAVIAQVGMSGLTQFPHLHFGVIWEGAIIDPFTGQSNTGTCGVQKKHLWKKDLVFTYQPLSIYAAGFSNIVPELGKIDNNSKPPLSLPKNSELLAFWVNIFGVRQGDKITLEIKDSQGKIFAKREIEQPANRARQFYFTGRKLNGNSLKEGVYTAYVKISRQMGDGKIQSWDKTSTVLITP